tara:strand:- start:1370 stop:1660 length:291 start_codon:yes stop_codon:yes gene_type:complete
MGLKYIMALVMTMFTVSSTSVEHNKAYILGFEDGSEAMTNAVNARACATYYQNLGQKVGPECHRYYENFKLRLAKYDLAKKKIEDSNNKKKKNEAI